MSGNGDINQLSGQKRKALREAIISAYPSINKLEIILSEELDKNLHRITQAETLDKVVFDIIQNAIAEGWLEKLIHGAIQSNPGNKELKVIAEELLSNSPVNLSVPPPNTDSDRCVGSDFAARDSYNIIQTQPFEFETATLTVRSVTEEKPSGLFGLLKETSTSTLYDIKRSRRQGKSFKEDLGNGVLLEMVEIPGGTFLMGSPEDEPERRDNEGPQHQVTVQPFFMGKFPVTQQQYEAIMGENPSSFKGKNKPVESVTWDNAVEFCAKISLRTGKAYRLPSEAEWEYACRAGTTTAFYFGETITTDLANYHGNYTYGSAPRGQYREQTTDVGSFPANAFGLYDMHGNVYEWCEDAWHENYNGAPTDGYSWVDSSKFSSMLRGGSWNYVPGDCWCAFRDGYLSGLSFYFIGFRVVVASPRTYHLVL